jgi:hypothetical protein
MTSAAPGASISLRSGCRHRKFGIALGVAYWVMREALGSRCFVVFATKGCRKAMRKVMRT